MVYDSIIRGGDFDPFAHLEPKEYVGLVESVNLNYLEDLRNILEPVASRDCCIVVVGSDGKRERHSQSKTEIVVIQTDQIPNVGRAIREYMGEEFYHQHFDLAPDGKVEVKYLLRNRAPFSYAYGDYNAVYPDRTLNSHFVVGNKSFYYQSRMQVVEEMCFDETGSRIRKKLKEQLDTYKSAMKRGVFRGGNLFDTEQAVQFYYESQDALEKVQGFKMSYLRAVQRKLDLIVVKSVMSNILPIEEAAVTMPTSTIGRLQFLHQNGIIDPSLSSQVEEAYGWFLQQYHIAQDTFKREQDFVAVPFNKYEYDYYRRIIEEKFVYI